MLSIEIFSDIVCPWCFIGKKRLDKVLATEIGEGVILRWRPYQLYPNLPDEGVDRAELLHRRYGDQADPGRVPSRIAEEAEGEGLAFRFDLIERTPNTLLAHRLMEYAFPLGVQHEMSEALFQAYFQQGRDVGRVDELVIIAAEVGLDAALVEEFLISDAAKDEVLKQLARAPELGISGVPGYYLAESFLLPGAQTSETMGQIISRVKARIAQ